MHNKTEHQTIKESTANEGGCLLRNQSKDGSSLKKTDLSSFAVFNDWDDPIIDFHWSV